MTQPQTIILSGPMTGLHEYNRPAFHAAANALRLRGHTVVNPAQTELPIGATWGEYMGRCLEAMRLCDEAWRDGRGPRPILAQLPGWEQSRGARIENAIAQECGWWLYSVADLLAEGDGDDALDA